jgi:tryptophan-rich sensory protein
MSTSSISLKVLTLVVGLIMLVIGIIVIADFCGVLTVGSRNSSAAANIACNNLLPSFDPTDFIVGVVVILLAILVAIALKSRDSGGGDSEV